MPGYADWGDWVADWGDDVDTAQEKREALQALRTGEKLRTG